MRPAAADQPYRLEDQIGFVLRKAGQRHAAIFARHMVKDLTPTQWAALVKAGEHDFISQNQLGRETAMDAATIKGVVDRLVKHGFLETCPDPQDGRRSQITLTPAGRAALAAGLPAARAITEETLAGLSSGERQILLELLRKIA